MTTIDPIAEQASGGTVDEHADATSGLQETAFIAVAGGRGAEVKRFVRTQPLGVLALVVILLFFLVAIFAPWLAPHDPIEQDRQAQLVGPTSGHILGTDILGRDVLSRLIYGARISLYVGGVTTVLSFIIGGAIGIVAGYIGRWVDGVLQAMIDALLCIPPLVLALFVAALLGASVRNVVIALTVLSVPRMARIARGEMLRIKSLDYVESTHALGGSSLRIMALHGLPNMMPSLIVVASLGFGNAIVAEAALSLLGVGTPPPNPSWGLMLSDGTSYFQIAPWLVVFPGIAISLIVLAFNLFGDTIRDYLDPKLVR
jgi:peptide/nickel transport system permease protein